MEYRRFWISVFFIFIAFLSCLTATRSYAQAQRMALATGSYQIAPKSSKLAKAYCLDYMRPSPIAENLYMQIFSGFGDRFGDLFVRVGDNRIPFDQALKEGKIAIKGTGGYTQLSIENLTDQQISVVINHHVILGEAGDTAPQLDANDIKIIVDNAQDINETQEKLWATEILKINGYARSRLSVTELENAIRQFQNDYQLKETGSLDSQTTNELMLLQYLRKITTMSDNQYAIILIGKEEKPYKTSFYRVHTYGDKPVFVDKASVITELATKQAQAINAKRTYLIPLGFSKEEHDAFSANLAISLLIHNSQPKAKMILLESKDVEKILDATTLPIEKRFQINEDVFGVFSATLTSLAIHNSQPKAKIIFPELKDVEKILGVATLHIENNFQIKMGPLSKIQSGPNKGFFRKTIIIITQYFSIIIEITARAAELINHFVARLEADISTADLSKISLLALAYKARDDIKSHYNLTDKQFDEMVSVNISGVHISQIMYNLWTDRVAANAL